MLNKYLKAGFGGAGSQLINLISLPVIVRFYGPEEFAVWAMVMAVAGIAGGISCFRYELAIVIPSDDQQAAALFWLCILSSAAIALVAAILLFISWHLGFLRGNDIIGLSCYTIFTPLIVFSTGCSLALRYWHVRLGNFALNSFSMIAFALVAFISQAGWAIVVNGDYPGLLIGSLLGQMATVLTLLLGTKRHNFPELKQAVPSLMIKTGKSYKRFLQFSTPYALFGIIRNRVPVLVLGAFLSSREVGLYALAFRVLYFPLSLVSSALRPVIFQAAAVSGVEAVKSQIIKVISVLAVIVTPAIVFYFFYADELFRLFFGARWAEAGHIGKFIIVPVYFFLFCSWMDRIMDVLGQQKLMFNLELFFACSSIIGLWFGFFLGWGLNGALSIQCLILSAYAITYLLVSFDRAGYNKIHLLKTFGMATAIALTAYFLLSLSLMKIFRYHETLR